MSRLNPARAKPILPYWACLALWAALGPLGAAPAACRRWARACCESSLALAGALCARRACVDPSADPALAWLAAALLGLSIALWVGDLWRLASWHGRPLDPLLDSPTEA